MKSLITLLFCFVLFLSVCANAGGSDSGDAHVAIVTEVLNNSGYTYIRYEESGVEGWIALPQIAVKSGDWIEFPGGQPLHNFKSEAVGRTFNEIYFVPGLRKVSRQESLKQKDEVFKSEDDEGTLVFTDDPSKIPAKKSKRSNNP